MADNSDGRWQIESRFCEIHEHFHGTQSLFSSMPNQNSLCNSPARKSNSQAQAESSYDCELLKLRVTQQRPKPEQSSARPRRPQPFSAARHYGCVRASCRGRDCADGRAAPDRATAQAEPAAQRKRERQLFAAPAKARGTAALLTGCVEDGGVSYRRP